MSLRLVCGRSGSGKSEFCLNETIEKLNDNKIYIITPEQFSYSVEKKLMDKVKAGAILNAEVLTFKRMAYRLENEVEGAKDSHLSKAGKAMLIYSILLDNKNNLKFLGKSEQNIEIVDNALTEFKKHSVSLEDLKNVTENEEDKYLKEKLKDLSYIYEKFEEKIQDRYIDENDILTILANNLDKTDMFKDCIFYIDEFTGYTKQEYKIIEKLLKIAKQTTITITTDDLDMGTEQDTDIFYSNKQTADKLLYIARNNNIECEKTVFLNDIYRFKNQELAHMEQNLYKIPYTPYKKDVENIQLFLAANAYSETENVAKQITKLVKNEHYRYRDISIITKDLETYGSLTKAIFNNYDIPVFIDEKKNLSQNMFIKYIISILDVFTQSFSYEAMMNYIKTGYLKIDDDEIFLLENYCRKWGIKGSKWYEGEWNFGEITDDNKEIIERIKILRNQIITPLLEFKNIIQTNKTYSEISKKLYEFLLKNNIEKILTNKKSKLEERGFIEIANEQELAWNIIINVLDEIEQIFKDEKATFDEYTKILRVGLNSSGLGIIPQTQDQVILGNIERSRTHKVKAVFILGMNDGAFPTVHKDEGFLGDKDREALKEKGIELAKTTTEALYEDNFSIYKAFTTAEEKLFLSHTSSNLDGGALRPSILINKIKKIFPNLKEQSDLFEQPRGIEGKENDDLLIQNLTFDKLIINLDKFRNGEDIDSKWFQIYNYFAESEEWSNKLKNAIKAMNYINKPQQITKDNIDKLYGNTLHTSVSKLEKYKSCPFSYYLMYGLKLKDNDIFKVNTLDTGNFMHDVIDTFFKTTTERGLKAKELEEEQVEQILNEIIDEKLSLGKNYILTSTAKNQTLTRRLKRVIFKSMKYILEGLKQSDFDVLGTEVEFGTGKTYEPMILNLDDGKKTEITGKIDRIDLAQNEDGKYIRIIDYKSSVKDMDLNEVKAGLKIQLLTYLDATCTIEEMKPAGVLYYNLIDPVISGDKYKTEEQIENDIKKQFKMDGLILADVKVIKMMDKNMGTDESLVVNAKINGDGSIKKKANLITKEQFEDLQKYIGKIVKDISKEILSGKIDIVPSYNMNNKRTACEYCKYKTICQFKAGSCGNNYNYISKKKKEEVLEEIKNS